MRFYMFTDEFYVVFCVVFIWDCIYSQISKYIEYIFSTTLLLLHITTTLLLYKYILFTTLLLHHINTTLLLYKYILFTTLLLLHYYYITTTLLLLHYYYITTTLPLHYYYITTTLLLHYYYITTALLTRHHYYAPPTQLQWRSWGAPKLLRSTKLKSGLRGCWRRRLRRGMA